MKWVFSLLALLLIPGVSGLILVDDLSTQMYNIGDTIGVSGYILQDKDMFGRLQMDLSCDEQVPLFIRAVSLKRGERFDFDEQLPLPLATKGNCRILLSLHVDDKVKDQTGTNDFEISDRLRGNFTLENKLIQLGKNIKVDGVISKLNGKAVDGVAVVYLTLDGENHLVNSIPVEHGKLSFTKSSESNLPGEYFINIEVNDMYGNHHFFDNILKFTLVDEISVFVDLNKKEALPGIAVLLFGEAKTILKEKLEDGFAIIYLGGEQYKTRIKKGGQFDYRIELPENISSGKQVIRVLVEDLAGNRGEAEAVIQIIAIPYRIEFEVPEGALNPKDEIMIKPLLYDQAGDLLDEVVQVQVIDVNKDIIFEEAIRSNQETRFILPENAIPGVWRVVGKTAKIEGEEELYLGEVSALDFRVEDWYLAIVNIGNVKFEGVIKMKISNAEESFEVEERIKLKAGDEKRINLASEVAAGVYTVEVQDKIFEGVSLAGKPKRFTNKIFYWISLAIVIIILIYLTFFRTKMRIIKKIRRKKKVEERYVPKKKIISAEDTKKEFLQGVLKQVEDRDRKIKKDLKFKFKKEGKGGEGFRILGRDKIKEEKEKEERKKSGGLFGMFD